MVAPHSMCFVFDKSTSKASLSLQLYHVIRYSFNLIISNGNALLVSSLPLPNLLEGFCFLPEFPDHNISRQDGMTQEKQMCSVLF